MKPQFTFKTQSNSMQNNSSQSMMSVEKPKPGSNSFHWFCYYQKLYLGLESYNYKDALAEWQSMSESEKQEYASEAKSNPKHKKLPGRQRAVSGYDVLRRELKNNNLKVGGVNMNTMASEIRAWLVINYPNDWDNWTTTTTKKHLKLINKAIGEIRW